VIPVTTGAIGDGLRPRQLAVNEASKLSTRSAATRTGVTGAVAVAAAAGLRIRPALPAILIGRAR
jgi:hypothetical protein